ncbi:hypothetical protein BBJ28_00003164 [Nothophytophthora sp. Chile5]|nr:hypothetical protein BBJ28_00003164 [Nothophytophthora sp. Chile5]
MKLPHMEQNGSISQDELVVLQLLEEIHQLVGLAGGDANPRLHPAAKLYLDTRDTFEVIENLVEEHLLNKPRPLRKLSKQLSTIVDGMTLLPPVQSTSQEPERCTSNDAVIDRIQDMFRHLGGLLGHSILKELRLRKLSIRAVLHYVRFLPVDYQWTAYKEARKEEVALAYRETVFSSLVPSSLSPAAPLTDNQALKQRADFVKQHIRKDVDTVCLFASDGTLSTIFGDDASTVEENVAARFESLIADVYSHYLRDTLDTQMEHLTQLSDQWAHDMAVSSNDPIAAASVVQCFTRQRKFRSKSSIFPNVLVNLVDRSAHLPVAPPGQQPRLLVADARFVGVWWQKSLHFVSERDVTTLHNDASREIVGRVETLDGQFYVPLLGKGGELDNSRLFGRSGGLAKWIGQRVLVNNGKDSVWIEVTVLDIDDKRCKLEVKKSLHKCTEVSSWAQFLTLSDWVNVRELRFVTAPVNPNFRVHMGLKFREVLEAVQTVVVEVSSVFPNGELNEKVSSALWKSLEPAISKGEHIFARYFRSILQQEAFPQGGMPLFMTTGSTRSLSSMRTGSTGNLASPALETALLAVGRELGNSLAVPLASISRTSISVGRATSRPGYFDGGGVYQYRRSSRLGRGTASSRAAMTSEPAAARVLSPFEKLAHHLLEETEIIGTCIQAQNIALSCAFVQVLLEKIAKMQIHLQATLRLPSCTVEQILSEYANSCRLLFVWRICRHQVDFMAKQRRTTSRGGEVDNGGRYVHLDWVDHSFERVEIQILDMMDSLVHFAHRAFFHKCMIYLLPGIYEQAWTASKSWFSNTRCTYAIQTVVFRLQVLFEYATTTVLAGYERNLGVHEKVFGLAVRMLLDVTACVAVAYEDLVVSRARETQWKLDVLYLVCGVYKLLQQLELMLASRAGASSAKGKRKGTSPAASMLDFG